MQVTLDVSKDIAREFSEDPQVLSRIALEALAIEGARSGKLTTDQVRRLLGFSTRYETDGFLKQHEVYYQLTPDDIRRDAATALEFSQCSSSPTHRQ